ncbi:hypothetical protein ONA00_05240 [Mycoplasmopsis cynos]|uniref:hypothetical protein n=1 Tax=Mycoplasmopsis cynos TaxID=171284 RepID=UPI0024C71119|nr:hypothetical protein [Mycoplasmopsis cynos]WAM10717.1 hypothetical protein ONA00_05240 [Mycoplasmopsis cynos]
MIQGSISVPVGEVVLGRMFDVLGNPIDEMPLDKDVMRASIHAPSPSYEEQKLHQKFLKQVLKSLIFWYLMQKVEKLDFLVVLELEKLF